MADKDKKEDKKDHPPPPEEKKHGHEHHPEHHHGKDFAKKAENAFIFGAGATAGSDAMKSFLKNV